MTVWSIRPRSDVRSQSNRSYWGRGSLSSPGRVMTQQSSRSDGHARRTSGERGDKCTCMTNEAIQSALIFVPGRKQFFEQVTPFGPIDFPCDNEITPSFREGGMTVFLSVDDKRTSEERAEMIAFEPVTHRTPRVGWTVREHPARAVVPGAMSRERYLPAGARWRK